MQAGHGLNALEAAQLEGATVEVRTRVWCRDVTSSVL